MPTFQIQTGDVVNISLSATDADPFATTGNVSWIFNSYRGALLGDDSNTLIANPSMLLPTYVCPQSDTLCQARRAYLCSEVIAGNASNIGNCEPPAWPAKANPDGTVSVQYQQVKVSSYQSQSWPNRSTFSYQFTVASSALGVPNAYRQVCLQATSPGNMTVPIEKSGVDCVLFQFKGAASPVNCMSLVNGYTLLLDPQEDPLAACGARSLLEMDPSWPVSIGCGSVDGIWCSWPVYVAIGQTLRGKVYFQSSNVNMSGPTALLDIPLASNPGLPNGASIGSTVAEQVAVYQGDSSNPLLYPVFTREISLTPTVSDLELSSSANQLIPSIQYQACFTSGSGASATTSCASIRVVRPEPRIIVGQTDFPLSSACVADGVCDVMFDGLGDTRFCSAGYQTLNSDGSCTPSAQSREVRIRCNYSWSFSLFDQRSPLEILGGLHHSYYTAVLEEDPLFPLPPGARLSAPEFEYVTLATPTKGGASITRKLTVQKLLWQPARDAVGRNFTICLLLKDKRTPLTARRVCSVTFAVKKCEACTRAGDTLKTLAEEFSTDWLQLWGANQGLYHPNEFDASALPYVKLGPLYTPVADETATMIATTFQVPYAALVGMNPDLGIAAPGHVVRRESSVCLVPSMACTASPDAT